MEDEVVAASLLALPPPHRPVSMSVKVSLILVVEVQLALLVSAFVAAVTVFKVVFLAVVADVIALCIVQHFVVKGLAQARLLERGELGFATLVGKTATGLVASEDTPFHRYDLELRLPNGESFTYRDNRVSETQKLAFVTCDGAVLEEKPRVPLFYMRSDPSRFVPFDTLPVKVTKEATFVSDTPLVRKLIPFAIWWVAAAILILIQLV